MDISGINRLFRKRVERFDGHCSDNIHATRMTICDKTNNQMDFKISFRSFKGNLDSNVGSRNDEFSHRSCAEVNAGPPRFMLSCSERRLHQGQTRLVPIVTSTHQNRYVAFFLTPTHTCLTASPNTHTHTHSPDSPLCSPKNTSLNFLRGFPKSPPADMVADKTAEPGPLLITLMFFYQFLFSRSVSPFFPFFFCVRREGGKGGSSSPHGMVGMQLSILLSSRSLVRMRDLTFLLPLAWSNHGQFYCAECILNTVMDVLFKNKISFLTDCLVNMTLCCECKQLQLCSVHTLY